MKGPKRSRGPGNDDKAGGPYKKSKGGTAGRWQTPHQRAKLAQSVDIGAAIDIGDAGIWVTFARGMRSKAIREFEELCQEYADKLYDVKPPQIDPGHASAADNEPDDQDIETSVQKEISKIKSQAGRRSSGTLFSPVSTGIECLFFMKTKEPVEPVSFVRSICQDARDCPDPRLRKCRYINRLTPVTDTDKATDNGILRVASSVLVPWFALNGGAVEAYAIRYNIRKHNTLNSGEVISKIANLVHPRHKVNLENPDKVILVEIFRLFCSMSVIDGKSWLALKRYNMNELYGLPPEEKEHATTGAAGL